MSDVHIGPYGSYYRAADAAVAQPTITTGDMLVKVITAVVVAVAITITLGSYIHAIPAVQEYHAFIDEKSNGEPTFVIMASVILALVAFIVFRSTHKKPDA